MDKPIKKPNFFIVGAPKCGTTALSVYLGEHPNIFMSDPKEPHYFATDLSRSGIRPMDCSEDYLKCFKNVSKDHVAVGEASVFYLYSLVAMKNIYEFSENSKIIVMVRNPIEMAYSLHSQLYQSLDEDISDFRTAWNMQECRSNGENIPRTCRVPRALQYKQICMHGRLLYDLYEIFPKENVHVILFDEFVKNTNRAYSDALSFLDVPHDGKCSFPKINANKFNRYRFLEYLLSEHHVAHAMGRKIKNILGIKSFKIHKPTGDIINLFNKCKAPRKEIPSDFKVELINEFQSDVKKLSLIINKDLNHWLS